MASSELSSQIKLEELHNDVKHIVAYVPKIESALERLLHVQDTLRSFAEVHKELFTLMRKMQSDLTELEIGQNRLDGRLRLLEESRKGVINLLSPVGTTIIIGLLLVVIIYLVSHGIVPGSYTNIGR